MTIDTQDELVPALGSIVPQNRCKFAKPALAATTGRMTSLWTPAGQPGAGATNLGQSAAGAVPTSSSTGAYPFTNPTGGASSYAGRAIASMAGAGMLVLYDVLWVWGSGGSGWSVTTTTAQNTSAPAALTRPDANGAGTEVWLEVLSAMGSGAATPVIGYTNSGGTSGRTSTAMAYSVSGAAGSMFQFPLQAGDTGVQSIQSLTLSVSMASGTARVIIARPTLEIPISGAYVPAMLDFAGLGLPQIYDSACLMWTYLPSSTTTGPANIKLDIAQG